jgi:mannose/cellobiose epimerase-like protein (N-acyl-D-glucosamine 2-epimerase family)
MASTNRTRESGPEATTPRDEVFSIADIARVAQSEHTQMAELLMATVSFIEEIEQRGERINFANLRKSTTRTLRMSAVMHAAANADLIEAVDENDLGVEDREYIDKLTAYAKSIEPEPLSEGEES